MKQIERKENLGRRPETYEERCACIDQARYDKAHPPMAFGGTTIVWTGNPRYNVGKVIEARERED